jgi:cytochrome oxidase Cu insertion factor (SCO1/SenC/PrrC family)
MRGLQRCAAPVCATLLWLLTVSCSDTAAPPSESEAHSSAPTAVELKVGDPAPPFSLTGSDGKVYSLASYKDRQAVVLAWFAKAFTGP